MSSRKIEVLNYSKEWAVIFETEKALLKAILGDVALSIEHIGSTAVPNLAAKPVIDILIEVADIHLLDTKTEGFQRLNYEVKGENGIVGRRYFQKGGVNRTHHIHAFQSGSPALCRHIAFRDYLIAYPAIANQYAAVKKEAAINCKNDSQLYMRLKNEFISKHEDLAVKWFGC